MTFNDKLKLSGEDSSTIAWFGKTLVFSFFIGIIFSFVAYVISMDLVIGIISLLITMLIVLLALIFRVYYIIDKKKRHIEQILPDFLMLVSANIRSGMSPIIALKNSARPEFEPLSSELEYVAVKSLGTDIFMDSLMLISKNLNSQILERTFALFVTSYVSGGNTSSLLEGLAIDIKETQQLKRKIGIGVNVYILFIIFSISIVMPILLSVSVKFLEMTSGFGSAYLSVDLGFLMGLYVIMLIVTSVLASSLVGVIKSGNYVAGYAYAFILPIISVSVFFISKLYFLDLLFA